MEMHDVGPNYQVLKNQTWVPAEIHNLQMVQTNWPLYRVHYANLSSRYDEWVTADKIRKLPFIRKETTSQRRSSGVSICEAVSHLQRRQKNEEIAKELRLRRTNPYSQQALVFKERAVDSVQFGMNDLVTWYPSKYVDPYGRSDHLYVCEYCCKYVIYRRSYCLHRATCTVRHPPGIAVYHKDNIGVWEVDGEAERTFCQNLGLVSKLFIKNKGMVYSTQFFYYYVVCEAKGDKWAIAAYFSKDKHFRHHNLSSLLTFPHYRKRGIGAFMIQMSYEMSKREGRVGRPEKPLSILGQRSYVAYWVYAILKVMKEANGKCFTVAQLSAKTFIAQEDVLTAMNLIEPKTCRGRYGCFFLDIAIIDEYFKKLDEESNHWKIMFDQRHFIWVNNGPGLRRRLATSISLP